MQEDIDFVRRFVFKATCVMHRGKFAIVSGELQMAIYVEGADSAAEAWRMARTKVGETEKQKWTQFAGKTNEVDQ